MRSEKEGTRTRGEDKERLGEVEGVGHVKKKLRVRRRGVDKVRV